MISVCIATHNGGKYIKKQLQSILIQLKEKDEVIISDDGSTDCTIDEVLSLNDRRVKVIQIVHKIKNKRVHYYVTKNFENALHYANGDYIFLADQDDVWASDKVKTCLTELEHCDLVISNLEYVDSKLISQKEYIYSNEFHFRNYFMRQGKYYGCAMVFKRKVLEYVLPFPKELLLHDFWIGMMVELLGNVSYIDIPLVKYRIHSSNTSESQKNKNSLAFKIEYRIYTMWNILHRYVKYRFLLNKF